MKKVGFSRNEGIAENLRIDITARFRAMFPFMETHDLLTIIGSLAGTIIATGVVLSTMILTAHRRLDGRIDSLDRRIIGRIDSLDRRMNGLDLRVARIEGMVHAYFRHNEPPPLSTPVELTDQAD